MLALDNHFHHCGLLSRLAGRCVWQPQTRAQQFGSLPQGEGDEGKQCDNVGAGLRDVDKRIEGKRVRRTSFCNHSPSSMRVQASGCAPSSGCCCVDSPERRRRRNGKHFRRFARLSARGIYWSLLFSPCDSSVRWWKWNGNSNPKPKLKGGFRQKAFRM